MVTPVVMIAIVNGSAIVIHAITTLAAKIWFKVRTGIIFVMNVSTLVVLLVQIAMTQKKMMKKQNHPTAIVFARIVMMTYTLIARTAKRLSLLTIWMTVCVLIAGVMTATMRMNSSVLRRYDYVK
jgi:hypothetical protein